MITTAGAVEAAAAAGTVLDALINTLQGSTGSAGATLKYLCSRLKGVAAEEMLAGGYTFWADLMVCFEAAQAAGATFSAMDAVRATAEALVVSDPAAVAVQNLSIRMSLLEEARILAATTFTSRQDIDAYFSEINASFERAELIAADNLDNVAYRALIKLHAAVSNDLANRSRPLPRMVSYTMPRQLPALLLAQRLYADGSRADELIAENKPIHPLFMPPTGNALSK